MIALDVEEGAMIRVTAMHANLVGNFGMGLINPPL